MNAILAPYLVLTHLPPLSRRPYRKGAWNIAVLCPTLLTCFYVRPYWPLFLRFLGIIEGYGGGGHRIVVSVGDHNRIYSVRDHFFVEQSAKYSPCCYPRTLLVGYRLRISRVREVAYSSDPPLFCCEEQTKLLAWVKTGPRKDNLSISCLLYTSDAADDLTRVDL